MDTELSIIAEQLKIRVPYMRGDHNDRRTCVEFIERITSQASKKLWIKQGSDWVKYTEPLQDWKEAHSLLGPWANRASHTGSLTHSEVDYLIKVCQKSLQHFICPVCNEPIWTADQPKRKRRQCVCGYIQWRYN